MAKLEDLPSEPGHWRCGNSYAQEIVVTGELPNGYGKDNTQTLEPVATKLKGNWWSRKTEEEAAFIDEIQAARERFEEDLGLEEVGEALSAQESAQLSSLVNVATQNVKEVEKIYDYWDGKTMNGLPRDVWISGLASEWPLSESDIVSEHVPQCSNSLPGAWVEVQDLVGNSVQTVRYYFCHGDEAKQKRSTDRWAIKKLLEDAARAVRCAMFTMWRVVLYRRSLAEYDDIDVGTFIPQPPAPPPPETPAGPGGFKAPTLPEDPWVPPPPAEPPSFPTFPVDAIITTIDWEPPPTHPIPPPLPPPPIPPPSGPEGGPGPMQPTPPTSPPPGPQAQGERSNVGMVVGVAAVLVAGALFLRK
jgi:hypothetical protein